MRGGRVVYFGGGVSFSRCLIRWQLLSATHSHSAYGDVRLFCAEAYLAACCVLPFAVLILGFFHCSLVGRGTGDAGCISGCISRCAAARLQGFLFCEGSGLVCGGVKGRGGGGGGRESIDSKLPLRGLQVQRVLICGHRREMS